MIFPFIVLSKANELLKSTRLELEEARKTNQALSEIAKALQWMVNEKAGTHPQPPEAPPVQLFKRG
jgi:Co/Zn/Cd efflux system component